VRRSGVRHPGVVGERDAVDRALDELHERLHVGLRGRLGVRPGGVAALHVHPADLLVGLDERAHLPLVGGEPGRRVPPGGGQLTGQQVGADQGQAGAAPRHRRRAERRVAQQPDPAARPAVHHHLGDLVEVEVRGGVQVREDARGPPAEARHPLAQQPLLGLDVAVVDLEVGVGEGQHGHRPGGVGERPQACRPPGLLVVDQPAVHLELVGHGVEGQHHPEVAEVLLARPEDHRPQAGVQPVGPDHQVEAAPVAGREGHVDPVGVLGELGDPVAEQVLDAVAGVLVEHLGQVPAQDLDLRDVPVAAVVVGAVGLQHVPVRVDGVRARGVGAGRAHLLVQPHPHDDLFGHPARVDGLPAGAQPGSPLHHGDLGPPPPQPVGQRGPRDARPRHQDPRAAHQVPPLVLSLGRWTAVPSGTHRGAGAVFGLALRSAARHADTMRGCEGRFSSSTTTRTFGASSCAS